MATQNFAYGDPNYLSFIGSQNGEVTPFSKTDYISPCSSISGSTWNTFDNLHISSEMIDFDNSSFDDDEESRSATSSLYKASKKISKASSKTVNKGNSKNLSKKGSKRARNPWTPQEDAKLVELMKKHGQSWAVISSLIKGRTGKQIRDRYLNKLRPNIKCGDWTPQEDERLIALLQKIGNRWSLIATHLPGRTEGQVKNRFYSCIKKRLQLKGDLSQAHSLSRSDSEIFKSASASPQRKDSQFDFHNKENQIPNMFMAKQSYVRDEEEIYFDQSTTESPNSHKDYQNFSQTDLSDPIEVMPSYEFFNQMPLKTYSFTLPSMENGNHIDEMLNTVPDYYFEKSNPSNLAFNVDSFFSEELRNEGKNLVPTVLMRGDSEIGMQFSRGKAYFE
jgi:hypothetical protein